MSELRSLGSVLCVVLACWPAGCSDDDQAPVDSGHDAAEDADATDAGDAGDADEDTDQLPDPCLDLDGDGTGVNCLLDVDCDETDAETWATCGGRDACARMHVGCPCDQEGRVVACHTEGPLDTIDGDDQCYEGTRTCSGGAWGPCQGMTPRPYIPEEDPSGSGNGPLRQPVLGGYDRCPGTSCDQPCTLIHDCLTQPDLQPPNAENLVYDVRGSPVAVILLDPAVDGVFHRVIDAHCAPSEMPTWWALTFDLSAAAPQRVAIRARTAESEAALGTAEWARVVLCPDGPCTSPEQTTDREYDQGNLASALGLGASHLPWIELEVTLSAGGGGVSPRYQGHEVFFYCDPAD
jgi:hypothetical protein